MDVDTFREHLGALDDDLRRKALEADHVPEPVEGPLPWELSVESAETDVFGEPCLFVDFLGMPDVWLESDTYSALDDAR